jgi:hypothetical protein
VPKKPTSAHQEGLEGTSSTFGSPIDLIISAHLNDGRCAELFQPDMLPNRGEGFTPAVDRKLTARD